MSAFLNNTPIVAMFIPILTGWCKKNQVAPSRLLIPLSYLCILGGTCTLIGTSTNLVVNGLMLEFYQARPELMESLHPMGFFELGRVGLPYALIGIFYLILMGQRWLPVRKGLLEKLSDSSRDYLANLRVEADCPLAGKTVQEAGLRHLPGLFLIEVQREGQIISPVPPDQVLKAGDILTFTGVVDTIVDLKKIPGLLPDETVSEGKSETHQGRVLSEAVVSAAAPFVGKTIREADFRAAYNAAVVAVHRGGERLQGKVGDIVLRPGDTLLLQTGPHFNRANRNNPNFLLVSGVEDSRRFAPTKPCSPSVCWGCSSS
jgi:di/tricarboxylate transporter